MADTYVDMDKLKSIAADLKSQAASLSNLSGTLSTAAGDVSKGWSDENSTRFSQKFGQFSTATGALITEINNYAAFLTDAADKYESAQKNALNTMGGA